MNTKILYIFIALIIVEFVSGQIQQQSMKCGKNEIFKQCADKANRCEPSCAVPKPQICTEMCAPGCDCSPGYLRSKNGKCIRPNEC